MKILATLIILGCLGCATTSEQTVHSTPAPSTKVSNIDNSSKFVKRKVAIGRFTNETRSGQSFFLDKENNKIGKQAMDILSSKLFKTGKFIMFERPDLSVIEKELKLGSVDRSISSVDYLVIGSITEFGRKVVSEVGIFSRVKKQEVFAKVHIRVVNVRNSKIIYSESGKGVAFSEAGSIFGVGEKAGHDQQLNDKAIDAAITDLASNIIDNMLNQPWKGYVLDFQEGMLLISGGKSQNIKVGDQFQVFKKGKQVKNPQNNSMITLPGEYLADITVQSTAGETVEDEVSFAAITQGSLKNYISNKSFEDLYIIVKEDK